MVIIQRSRASGPNNKKVYLRYPAKVIGIDRGIGPDIAGDIEFRVTWIHILLRVTEENHIKQNLQRTYKVERTKMKTFNRIWIGMVRPHYFPMPSGCPRKKQKIKTKQHSW